MDQRLTHWCPLGNANLATPPSFNAKQLAAHRPWGAGARGIGVRGGAESWKDALIADIESGFAEGNASRLSSAIDPDYDAKGKWPEVDTFARKGDEDLGAKSAPRLAAYFFQNRSAERSVVITSGALESLRPTISPWSGPSKSPPPVSANTNHGI